MSDNKVSLHRIIKASPEKVFRAFTEALAIASWLPPYGFLCTVHNMDVKVGGTFRMSFHNFTTGNGHSFGGEYLEVKPNEYLKYTDKFDDPNLPGVMTTSISLKKTLVGTELKALQEGIPTVIPVEMCYLGWQESLEKLAKLVEPEIPDA
nr:SRPBCC family protein [Pedobacter panaciterrae]